MKIKNIIKIGLGIFAAIFIVFYCIDLYKEHSSEASAMLMCDKFIVGANYSEVADLEKVRSNVTNDGDKITVFFIGSLFKSFVCEVHIEKGRVISKEVRTVYSG